MLIYASTYQPGTAFHAKVTQRVEQADAGAPELKELLELPSTRLAVYASMLDRASRCVRLAGALSIVTLHHVVAW